MLWVPLSFLLMICCTFSTTPRQPAVESSTESDTTASEQSSAAPSDSLAPPGMSEAAVKRVKGDSPLEPNKLEQVLNTYSYCSIFSCNQPHCSIIHTCKTMLDVAFSAYNYKTFWEGWLLKGRSLGMITWNGDHQVFVTCMFLILQEGEER